MSTVLKIGSLEPTYFRAKGTLEMIQDLIPNFADDKPECLTGVPEVTALLEQEQGSFVAISSHNVFL